MGYTQRRFDHYRPYATASVVGHDYHVIDVVVEAEAEAAWFTTFARPSSLQNGPSARTLTVCCIDVRHFAVLPYVMCHARCVMQAMRLFVGEPVWTPLNRPQDDHPVRKDYVQNFGGAPATAATAAT